MKWYLMILLLLIWGCSGEETLPVEQPLFQCSECETWEQCDEVEKLCTPLPGRCGDSGDCDSSMRCNEQHLCVIKIVTEGCQPGGCFQGYCDTRSGYCVACLSDDHCAYHQYCSPGNRCMLRAGYCELDGHCNGVTPRCDQTQHLCKNCIEEADCETYQTCEKGSCINQENRCGSDDDCPDEIPHCTLADNRCESPCNLVDCPVDQNCIVKERQPICICREGLHVEGDQCVSNEKIVNCKDEAPENGYSLIITALIQWDDELGRWAEPFSCLWRCNDGYHQDGDQCVSD